MVKTENTPRFTLFKERFFCVPVWFSQQQYGLALFLKLWRALNYFISTKKGLNLRLFPTFAAPLYKPKEDFSLFTQTTASNYG